jgi:FtsH-binding integral membrane protein
MAKILEIIGLVLVVIMSLGFVGVFEPNIETGLSPLFWGCAGGTLIIIMYRKRKRKQAGKE